MYRGKIRILVVGDAGVGKTSLITALVSENFPEKVADVLPNVSIPPEATPAKVATELVDTRGKSTNATTLSLNSEIEQANCICILYDSTKTESFERVTLFWIPELKKVTKIIPVIVVASKCDLLKNLDGVKEQGKFLATEFPETQFKICSAKSDSQLDEVLAVAQNAVLYPSELIYDKRNQKLSIAAEKAFSRIFYLLDKDVDDKLDDTELIEFQKQCFGSEFKSGDLQGIKTIIKNSFAKGIENDSVNLFGFLGMMFLFAKSGKFETLWKILRRFGYEDDLTLSQDFLAPKIPDYEAELDDVFELKAEVIQFLTDLFSRFDKDKDGVLSTEELNRMFVTNETGHPFGPLFPHNSLTAPNGSVTLTGFLANWAVLALDSYRECMKHLALIGYDKSLTEAFEIHTRSRELRRGTLNRNIINCMVIGAKNSGKTTFLQGLLGKGLNSKKSSLPPKRVVVPVKYQKQSKYLVMYEGDESKVSDEKAMSKYDCLCMLFDCSNAASLKYLEKAEQKLELPHVGVVVVGTKNDLLPAKNSGVPALDEFCSQLKLKPKLVTMKDSTPSSEIYEHIVAETHRHYQSSRATRWWLWGTVLGTTVLVVGFAVKNNGLKIPWFSRK